MKRGIVASDGLVVCLGNDLVTAHHHGTDRDFVLGRRKPGLVERRIHPSITTHHAPRTTHCCYARTVSLERSNVSELPSLARSARTRSPSVYCPSRTAMASGFCSSRWIARFKGRAPYTGS